MYAARQSLWLGDGEQAGRPRAYATECISLAEAPSQVWGTEAAGCTSPVGVVLIIDGDHARGHSTKDRDQGRHSGTKCTHFSYCLTHTLYPVPIEHCWRQ